MNKQIYVYATLCLLLLGGLTACGPQPTTPPPSPQAWIDAPLNGSTLPLAPYTLVFHGSSVNGITEFEIKVNGSVIGMVAPLMTGPGEPPATLFYGEHGWTPAAPGNYLIAVRARSETGGYGPPAEVQVTVAGGAFTEIQTPLPLLPTPTASASLGQCLYTAAVNLFCRLGPGAASYPEVDSFTPGQFAPVVGISPDELFAYVEGPNSSRTCAVPVDPEFGELSGDCSDLPIFNPPPTFTPTPTDTPTAVPLTATPTSTPTVTPIPPPK